MQDGYAGAVMLGATPVNVALSVDPIAVTEIQKIILDLKERGIGILLTDHNVRETLNTTDRSFIILDGRIIAQGDRDAILADANARKHYLGEEFKM